MDSRNPDVTQAPSKAAGIAEFFIVVLVSAFVVTVISLMTNRMAPLWDMVYYVDMATNGIAGNRGLYAPFAYRPGAPLMIGEIAKLLGIAPQVSFRICAHIMSGAFIVSCFYFAKSLGARRRVALFTAVTLASYFYIIKWHVFADTMVDIYCYPFILFGFWALLQERFYTNLLISAVGLFFKEFMLLPLMTYATVLGIGRWRNQKRRLLQPFSLTLLVLLISFILPRLLIHVAESWQDIDPMNNPRSIFRLFRYPANWKRHFNIVFAYLAWWLPVLLLMNRQRFRLAWKHLEPRKALLAVYMVFHYVLVMYGGTNIAVFVTYSLPIEIMLLTIILSYGDVPLWEQVSLFLVVVVFNRLWLNIPSPTKEWESFYDFYTGHRHLVDRASLFRMAEVTTWILGFWTVRRVVERIAQKPA
jgi:hypothetical protein